MTPVQPTANRHPDLIQKHGGAFLQHLVREILVLILDIRHRFGLEGHLSPGPVGFHDRIQRSAVTIETAPRPVHHWQVFTPCQGCSPFGIAVGAVGAFDRFETEGQVRVYGIDG